MTTKNQVKYTLATLIRTLVHLSIFVIIQFANHADIRTSDNVHIKHQNQARHLIIAWLWLETPCWWDWLYCFNLKLPKQVESRKRQHLCPLRPWLTGMEVDVVLRCWSTLRLDVFYEAFLITTVVFYTCLYFTLPYECRDMCMLYNNARSNYEWWSK